MHKLDCGHAPTVTDGIGTGTARDAHGRTFCYSCADERERAAIETEPAVTVYDATGLAGEDRPGWRGNVTTWTGAYMGTVIRRSTYRNGLTGSRMMCVTVRTLHGRIMHGRYGFDWGQAVTLRPSRAAVRTVAP